MTKKNILAGLILLVAGSLLIAACTPQQTPTTAPTIDANMIYTQAAETVQAGLAQTPVPPTSAPTETVAAATATMDPNMALALTATAQSVQPGGSNRYPWRKPAFSDPWHWRSGYKSNRYEDHRTGSDKSRRSFAA